MLDMAMTTAQREKQQTISEVPRIMRKVPFLPKLILENWLLYRELQRIKHRLSELEERIPEEKVIVLREIKREDAKKEIRELLKGGRTLYFSEIAGELSIDLELVVGICQELLEKGEIGVDGDALQVA